MGRMVIDSVKNGPLDCVCQYFLRCGAESPRREWKRGEMSLLFLVKIGGCKIYAHLNIPFLSLVLFFSPHKQPPHCSLSPDTSPFLVNVRSFPRSRPHLHKYPAQHSMHRLAHPLTALLSTVLLSLTLLTGFYIYQSPSTLHFSTPHAPPISTTSIPGLCFTLTQTSTSPPTLLVTLKNGNPDITYTLLKWATPLDTSALDIGVFSITAPDGTQVQQVIRKITRKMPPPPNQIASVRPGENATSEVVFDKSRMGSKGRYKIEAKGSFKGGWERERAEVATGDLYAFAESEFSGWRFGTGAVEMVVT